MYEAKDEQMHCQTYGCTEGQMDIQMNRWMDGQTNITAQEAKNLRLHLTHECRNLPI